MVSEAIEVRDCVLMGEAFKAAQLAHSDRYVKSGSIKAHTDIVPSPPPAHNHKMVGKEGGGGGTKAGKQRIASPFPSLLIIVL